MASEPWMEDICVGIYGSFAMTREAAIPDHAVLIQEWDSFLEYYDEKLQGMSRLSEAYFGG